MTELRGPYLLDPDTYPFVIEAIGHDDEVLWSQAVEKPEGLALLRIPGFGDRVKFTRCTFSYGKENETSVCYTPDGAEP
jgi:hypothetical protein